MGQPGVADDVLRNPTGKFCLVRGAACEDRAPLKDIHFEVAIQIHSAISLQHRPQSVGLAFGQLRHPPPEAASAA